MYLRISMQRRAKNKFYLQLRKDILMLNVKKFISGAPLPSFFYYERKFLVCAAHDKNICETRHFFK